jgi:hypothetical protein
MKLIKNCWDEISTYNCQYGAHIFDGFSVKIYVNNWLAVKNELHPFFYKKNDEGFVGHCLLVFHGIKQFDFSVKTHIEQDGDMIWLPPVTSKHVGLCTGKTKIYQMEGSLHGFASSVDMLIEAQEFELHILGKDEPARQSC